MNRVHSHTQYTIDALPFAHHITNSNQTSLHPMKGIAVLVALCLICVQGLTISLKSGKEQCIWEEGKIGDQLYASYEVTKGDSKGLIVTVRVFLSVVFVDQGQFWKAALFIQLQGGG